MNNPGTKEAKFIKAIKEVFIGVPVEGDSGYINLMRIKARYFDEGVFPRLMQDIEADLSPFPGFREELFDKLYSFFHRYFSESGSIYFRYTPLHQNVYEQVYTDDRDVMLFYKTRMLYYVKTDRLFQNLEVTVDGQRFSFDVSTLEHKKANEKRALVFNFAEQRGDTLVFAVEYSERGSKTKTADILKEMRKLGLKLGENTLTHAFGLFERQSEVDYFINKDAHTFLRRQFDLWLYQYVFTGEDQTLWTEIRLRQLQVLQKTARNIIDFIAQFEDELVKIWNKPKFALDSNYVITLDKLARRDPDLLRRLSDSPGFTAQAAEWQALGLVNDDFTAGHLWDAGLWADESQAQIPLPESESEAPTLAPAARFLPLDTAHFKDLEPDILALFDDLDDALDGWVINSDNYQALNTLKRKYAGQVQCIYIDPPYNTGSDEFIYSDKFRHASWLTLMENRLTLARELLSADEGSIFISIDDNEIANLKTITDQAFNPSNFVATVIWQKVFSPKNTAKYFSDDHDYILVYARDKAKWTPYLIPRSDEAESRYSNPDNDPRGVWSSSDLTARNYYSLGLYEVTGPTGKKFSSGVGRYWRSTHEKFLELDRDNRIWWGEGGNNMPRLKRFLSEVRDGVIPQTLWKHEDVGNTQEAKKEMLATSNVTRNEDVINTVKPTRLLRRIFEISTTSEFPGIILDFFAGSGTTGHAVINLNREDGGNRKYILVEMGQHFHTVILPRLKKVIYSDKWKDGKPSGGQGLSHFFKYYRLEQYEEALRRASYKESTLFNNPYETPYSSYVFLRDEKMLETVAVDIEAETVQVDLSKLYPGIDLAETLSCLHGRRIKRIADNKVEFDNGEQVDLSDPPWELVKPLVWW